MITNLFKSLGLLFFILISSYSNASSKSIGELKWTHYGLRPLAMGNAFVAIADDYNSIFYNPAGLARLKTWDGEFLNLYAEVSESSITAVNDIIELYKAGNDTEKVLNLIEGNLGKNHHVAFGLTPHFIMQNFGIGIGIEFNTSFTFHRYIGVDVDVGTKFIMPISYAYNIFDGFDVGASVKLVGLTGVDRTLDINAIGALSSDATKGEDGPKLSDYILGGYGIGFDIGILYTPVQTMKPTLGISITDLGSTKFTRFNLGEASTGAPDLRLTSVNTGFSIVPFETENMYIRTSIDVHAINQPYHFSKKFNLGMEWGYGSIIKLQGGLHQGAYTAGLQFDVGLFNIRFVSYAEQLGAIAGQDKDLEDRRYAFQFKLLL